MAIANQRSVRAPGLPTAQTVRRSEKLSRVVATLATGSGVTTSRSDVHYVVTAYGVAQLWGRTLRERAEALIAIAHPDFREGLATPA